MKYILSSFFFLNFAFFVHAADRPNILVILSDQHTPGVTGCYGNTVVQTVDLDNNPKLTDVDRLLAAVEKSGVVRVNLDGTGVSAEKQREMRRAMAANAARPMRAR